MKEFLHHLHTVLVAYGPWGVLALAAIDSMGVPLPAGVDALVIGVAAASAHAPGQAYLSALIAVVGSIAGNIFLFQAARHGRRLFGRGKEDLPESKRRKFRAWFHRYGLLTVFIPGVVPLIPLPLKVFVISAGALHTPLRRFVAVIVAARIIRYFGIAYLALKLGEDATGFLTRNGWTLAGVVLGLAFAAFWLIKLNDRRRSAGLGSLQ